MTSRQAPHPIKRRLRAVLKWLHLWLGLSVGLVFAIVALSGTVLAFQREILAWSQPQLTAAPLPAPAQREAALARIVADWQPRGLSSLDLPSAQLPVWQGYFPDGERRYFDGASGELLLVRNKSNDWMLWLRDLHTHLLAGKAGEQVLGAVGLIALFLLLSGLYLWWPRLSALGASLRWYRGPPTRRWFSWHRSAGALLLPLTLLAVLTGVGMVYDGAARGLLRTALGDGPDARKPPALPARAAAIDWAAVLRAADGRLPGAQLRRIGLPKGDSGLVTVRLRTAGEWHPVGRSMVWLDPYRARVLGVHDATAQDAGARASEALYPLHGGFVGGRPWQWLVAFTGLVPAFLLVTGFLFWRRRTASRRPLPAASR